MSWDKDVRLTRGPRGDNILLGTHDLCLFVYPSIMHRSPQLHPGRQTPIEGKPPREEPGIPRTSRWSPRASLTLLTVTRASSDVVRTQLQSTHDNLSDRLVPTRPHTTHGVQLFHHISPLCNAFDAPRTICVASPTITPDKTATPSPWGALSSPLSSISGRITLW